MTEGKYTLIWKRELGIILLAIKEGGKAWRLSPSDFVCAGNRHSYSFRIEYDKGRTPRDGSAVGRDLQDVLFQSSKFRELAINKEIAIRMSKDFTLRVEILKDYNSNDDDTERDMQVEEVVEHDATQDSSLCYNVNGFPPIEGPDSEILILGTAPGEDSLKSGEYYADKRNVFWKLLSKFFNSGKPFQNYQQKLDCLQEQHIAIWDTLMKCNRASSQDKDIKDKKEPNDLETFIMQHPCLKTIIFMAKKPNQKEYL